MAQTRTIDVQDFMIFHKLSSYQIRIIALCFLIVAIDGFDTAANAVGHSGSGDDVRRRHPGHGLGSRSPSRS